jgi:hypothetical protein
MPIDGILPVSQLERYQEGGWLLQNHDYARGWPMTEARTMPGRRGFPGTLADLRGKIVLVRGELGYGDCIQLMRYIPLLKKHSRCEHHSHITRTHRKLLTVLCWQRRRWRRIRPDLTCSTRITRRFGDCCASWASTL